MAPSANRPEPLKNSFYCKGTLGQASQALARQREEIQSILELIKYRKDSTPSKATRGDPKRKSSKDVPTLPVALSTMRRNSRMI